MRANTRRRFATLAGLVFLGCVRGAPNHFPSGDHWTVPLVGPLEGGPLVVPVYVQDTGPYLMVIDPDSYGTAIDDVITKALRVPTLPFGQVTDEDDVLRRTFAAEVQSLRLGDLRIRRQYYLIMKAGTLRVAGREIHGVIGRDIIDETLTFGFDRERGLAYITRLDAFTAPARATELTYDEYDERRIVPRRLVNATIGSKRLRLHIDLGDQASHVRPSLWEKAGMTPVAASFDMRDDGGTLHHYDRGAVAARVSVGAMTADQIVVAPYDDKRWDERYIDGTLGLDVLRRFNVWAKWNAKRVYLVPRGDELATVKERIGRWGSADLDRCAAGECATVRMLVPTVTDPEAAARARPVVTVERDGAGSSTSVELVLAAVGADGKASALPRLIVNLPAGTTSASTQVGPDYAGTQLVVVDASPYPRDCPHAGAGCIDSIAP